MRRSINGKCRWRRCFSNILHWRHNESHGVSNHRSHDYLLNCLFKRRLKKTSKLRVTSLCAGNSPVTGEFPTQRARNPENDSIWWRHHDLPYCEAWSMHLYQKHVTVDNNTTSAQMRLFNSAPRKWYSYHIYGFAFCYFCVICSRLYHCSGVPQWDRGNFSNFEHHHE